jgi:uncharacterized protein
MDSVSILPGFYAVGLTLHIPEEDVLAFADVHLGFEQALNKQGVLVPPFQYKRVAEHLNEALRKTRPKMVVVDGDLKHEFGGISAQEWAEVIRFLDCLKRYDVALVKGNHDIIIGPIATRKNVKVMESLKVDTTLFVHGDRIPEDRELKTVKTIVIGHEHPCIGLQEEGRTEKVKCFLTGKWRGIDLIVLPSLNFVTEGVDVLKERLLSPLLQGDIGDYMAWGVEEGRIMEFGRISEIK